MSKTLQEVYEEFYGEPAKLKCVGYTKNYVWWLEGRLSKILNKLEEIREDTPAVP